MRGAAAELVFDHCAEAVAAESTLLLDVGLDVADVYFGEHIVKQGRTGCLTLDGVASKRPVCRMRSQDRIVFVGWLVH